MAHHEGQTARFAMALRTPCGRTDQTHAIFEDTSEIQRLIIARAISGAHIQYPAHGLQRLPCRGERPPRGIG
jgi:hypothetical protein